MDRLLGVLDGLVIGSAKASRYGVEAEDNRGIGVDHRGAVDGRKGQVVIPCQGSAYSRRHDERQRKIGAPGNRHPSQMLCRLSVIVLDARPFHEVALLPAPRGQRIGGGIGGVLLQCLRQQPQRLFIVLRGFGKGR
jgi:hypothetical protein